jgi:hypothetical protein
MVAGLGILLLQGALWVPDAVRRYWQDDARHLAVAATLAVLEKEIPEGSHVFADAGLAPALEFTQRYTVLDASLASGTGVVPAPPAEPVAPAPEEPTPEEPTREEPTREEPTPEPAPDTDLPSEPAAPAPLPSIRDKYRSLEPAAAARAIAADLAELRARSQAVYWVDESPETAFLAGPLAEHGLAFVEVAAGLSGKLDLFRLVEVSDPAGPVEASGGKSEPAAPVEASGEREPGK